MVAMPDEQLLTEVNAREYFQNAVLSAASNQGLRFCDETVVYVTNILTSFLHTEYLYEHTEDGYVIKPLARFYCEAMESKTANGRDRALQRLGDIALFISGVFTDSLNRSLVDVDYYIAMGGNAYSCLADSTKRGRNSLVLSDVFTEMADRFDRLVEVLSEVSESNNMNDGKDVLRLYEVWLSTGSKRAAGKLQEQGVYPISMQAHKH